MTDTVRTIISKMQTLEQLPLVSRVTITLTTSGGGFFSVYDAEYDTYQGEFATIELAAQSLDNLLEVYASGAHV